MTTLIEVATSTWSFLTAVLLFGFVPGFVLRLFILIYPKGHPRRTELLGELYAQPLWLRLFFVAEQLETALFEGRSARRQARAAAKAAAADEAAGKVVANRLPLRRGGRLLHPLASRRAHRRILADDELLRRTAERILSTSRSPERIKAAEFVVSGLTASGDHDPIPSLWVEDYSAMTPVDEDGNPLMSRRRDGGEGNPASA